MRQLSFGQPAGGIVQMAYTVRDIRQAIEEWIARLKVGPCFLLEHFTGEGPVCRGRPSQADAAIAMAFAGHMNIELIQTNDAHPSVYKEAIEARGHGFHHWGIASDEVDADVERYRAMGMGVAFRAGVPTGGNVVYLDTRGRAARLRGADPRQCRDGGGLRAFPARLGGLGRRRPGSPVRLAKRFAPG